MLLNPELVLYIESIPDTVITLTTGEKLYVKESGTEIQKHFIEYKKTIFAEGLRAGLEIKK